jgi:hypothetical protein
MLYLSYKLFFFKFCFIFLSFIGKKNGNRKKYFGRLVFHVFDTFRNSFIKKDSCSKGFFSSLSWYFYFLKCVPKYIII